VSESKLVTIAEAAIAEVRSGGFTTLVALMRARDKFSEAVAQAAGGNSANAPMVTTAFTGVESGRIEAIIKSVKSTDRPYMSGGSIAGRVCV